MGSLSLTFAPKSNDGTGQYRLMELSKELVELVQNSTQHQITIRGRADDDAVLCTVDKTYSVRAVTVSNAFYILTPPNANEIGDAVIRGRVGQILELSPSIAKLHRLRGMLRGCEYDEDSDDRDRERHLLVDVKSELQASDAELEAGFKARRILIMDGELRPMTPSYLNTVLELILNTLVSLSLPSDAAPVLDISETLQSDHEIPLEISKQVMSWFGTIEESSSRADVWIMDTDAVVKQLGIGILSGYRSTPIDEREFMKKWRTTAGDLFESRIDLSLLKGNALYSQQTATTNATLSYFPSSELPINPSERFAELFLVQAKWRAADITPFLDEIAVDNKERDKLLLKFARGVTDKEGITWYTSRGGTVM